MPRVRLTFDAATCADPLAAISTEFPDEEFTVLSSYPMGDGILGLVKIETPDVAAIIQHFEDEPGMSYEVLHTDDQTALIQYTIPEPDSHRALSASGNLPQFPARLQDGWLSAEHAVSSEGVSQFPDKLAEAGIPYEIQSISHSHDLGELLTDRQWEFVTEAVKHGYYDSPRGCTLNELAEMFDVNASAASGILHRAEGQIIEEFIAEAARETSEV